MHIKSLIFAAALTAGFAAAAGSKDAAAQNIQLQGTAAQNCAIIVTSNDGNALNLPLTASGSQHVEVGTVTQNCNKKAGYTLAVTSTNCTVAPAGGKLMDSVSSESLSYSGEFANPTTGGSQASVTGLIASGCTNQVGRNVTNAKINGETSTVYVNFTGDAGLAAGTYTDTLTIALAVK